MFLIQNAHSPYIYTGTERRGNRQTMRETEKERVRVWECCRKTNSASVIKLTVGKNRRISNFWETILMEEGIEKIHKDKTFSHKTFEGQLV
jgi:hypothetical protein